MSKTINLIPNWQAAAQIYIMALENGTPEGVRAGREGVMEMAEKFDNLIAHMKEEQTGYRVYRQLGTAKPVYYAQDARDGAPTIWSSEAADALRFATLQEAEQMANDFQDYYASKGMSYTVGTQHGEVDQ